MHHCFFAVFNARPHVDPKPVLLLMSLCLCFGSTSSIIDNTIPGTTTLTHSPTHHMVKSWTAAKAKLPRGRLACVPIRQRQSGHSLGQAIQVCNEIAGEPHRPLHSVPISETSPHDEGQRHSENHGSTKADKVWPAIAFRSRPCANDCSLLDCLRTTPCTPQHGAPANTGSHGKGARELTRERLGCARTLALLRNRCGSVQIMRTWPSGRRRGLCRGGRPHTPPGSPRR